MINQKKVGIILSYFNTVLNMCVTMFLTPFLISSLGESEYGVYKIVASFASQLVIINFGIGSLVTRFVAKFNALEQKKEKENFLFMTLIISLVISASIGMVGYSLSAGVDSLFGASLTDSEIQLAKNLYLVLVTTTVISVFRDMFSGIMLGHERFVASRLIALGRIVFRVVAIIVLLKCGFTSMSIVVTDLVIAVVITIVEMMYCFAFLKEKIKFYYWDKKEFVLCLSFAGALVLQSIVNQVNQNLASVILGATITENVTAVVTLYSFALVIYNTYGNLTSVFSGVFVPQVTKMVVKDATPKQLTDIVISVGRYQMMIAGAVIFGFILCGKNFLSIWVGEEYTDAYWPTLILIIPVTIPFIESVAIAILDAKMKRMVRSIVLVIMALFNVISSIIFIKLFGYMGAAYGSALAMLLGHGLIMNLYYHKKIGLNIKRIFLEISKGILPSAVITAVVCAPISIFVKNTLIGFIAKGSVFILIYGLLLYFFGMNKTEKDTTVGAVLKVVNKVTRRLKR